MSEQQPVTIQNLEAAFAGESMAHIKYLYFAKICREQGDEETARQFEETASQEVAHALGHADLLFPRTTLNPVRCLELAIEGETHEYTEMYPSFYHTALEEQQQSAANEFAEQIEESKEHADHFRNVLEKAAKRFNALTKVEQRHANAYSATLAQVKQRSA